MLFSGKECSELTAYSCRNQSELLSLHRALVWPKPQTMTEHIGYQGSRAPLWGHLIFLEELSWRLRLSAPSCFPLFFFLRSYPPKLLELLTPSQNVLPGGPN